MSLDGINQTITGASAVTIGSTLQNTNTLNIVGEGGISPDLNRQTLEIGKTYKLKAKPAKDHVFSHWSGSVNGTSAQIEIEMVHDLSVTAHFIPNPFLPLQGQYHGLFHTEQGVDHHSSGFVRISLNSRGRFSSKWVAGSQTVGFSGQLDLDGKATQIMNLKDGSALTLGLQLDLQGTTQRFTGYLTDGIWTAQLMADRAVFDGASNPAPYAGLYTVMIPGIPGDARVPAGAGFGALAIDARGRTKWKGLLADGSKMAQNAYVSANGLWPLHVSLYGNQGSVMSWVSVEPSLSGPTFEVPLNWIHPANPGSSSFPGGFTILTRLVGSAYEPPASSSDMVLDFTRGTLWLEGGQLPGPFYNPIIQEPGLITSPPDTFPVTLKVNARSGLFSGQITDPDSGENLKLNGVLLQGQNMGAGFFMRGGQSGSVRLEPEP
jgi:hypothetical protein